MTPQELSMAAEKMQKNSKGKVQLEYSGGSIVVNPKQLPSFTKDII
jgi:argininosuccinate synthase